jgi:hypothetical protein
VGNAWWIGSMLHAPLNVVFQVLAAVVILASVSLVATELVEYPPPYDRRLWRPITPTRDWL